MNYCLGFVLLIFVSFSALADDAYLMSEKTYKALSAAQALMAEDKNNQAEKKLNVLLSEVEPGSYEQAVIQQTLGYLYSGKESYRKASEFFQKALDSNALPDKVSHDLSYNLGQLLIADEQYKKGVGVLEKWLKNEAEPPTSARVLLASAYYRIKNYKQSIKHIRIAIKSDRSAKEEWYQILLSSHLELKQYKSAIKVLEQLIPKYPYKKTYWSQLSALYLQQGNDFSALAVKMLAQRLELDDRQTLVNLADMYRYLNIPYKSALLLTEGIQKRGVPANYENLTKLADSWLAAKEYKSAAKELKKLARIDKSGRSELKLARVYFGMEDWKQAVDVLSAGLAKLSGKDIGEARLLLGMAHFNLDQFEKAKEQFSQAVAYEEQRNQAGQWLRHVEKILENQTLEQS